MTREPAYRGVPRRRAKAEVQPERERSDYDAWAVPDEEARRVIELARTFLTAIDEMLERLAG